MRTAPPILLLALLSAGCADLPSQPALPEGRNSVGQTSPAPEAAESKVDPYQIAYHKAWAGDVHGAAAIMMPLAQAGDSRAEYWIGSQYLTGWAFQQSDAEAVYWIRRAAEHGYALAQLNLGIMYRDGRRGLEQNLDAARRWFAAAAAQGDVSARAALFELEAIAI